MARATAANARPVAAATAGSVTFCPAGTVITGTYGACEPPLPYWLTIWLSTLNACPGMEKSFVIRWVVPLMVITPTAATTTQNRATSALWRSTKRVSAVIAISNVPKAGGRSADACQPAVRGPGPSSGGGSHLPVPPREQRPPAYSRGSSRIAYQGRATQA